MKKIFTMFEDKKGVSLTRVVFFLSFVISSYFVIKTENADAFAWFVGVYAAGYMGGKTEGIITAIKGEKNANTKLDKE